MITIPEVKKKQNYLKPLPDNLRKNKLKDSQSSQNINSTNTTEAEIELRRSKVNFGKANQNTNLEKIAIDCDGDLAKDKEFLSSLSKNELNFYKIRAKDLYNFLIDLNLVRYIDSFINDGFEATSDILEIKEDYFEENTNFTPKQQKKIIEKVEEMKLKAKQQKKLKKTKEKNEIAVSCEIPTQAGDKAERCFFCYNLVGKGRPKLTQVYSDSIIKREIIFCSVECQQKFEKKYIFSQCQSCGITYDKSKGDYIYESHHFHSQSCLDSYLSKVHKEVKEDSSEYDSEKPYDPMEDF